MTLDIVNAETILMAITVALMIATFFIIRISNQNSELVKDILKDWGELHELLASTAKLWLDSKVREEKRQEEVDLEALKLEAFNQDIENFPHGRVENLGVLIWGKPFRHWREELNSLVERGLSLDQPSDDFQRLKQAVENGIELNEDRVAMSTDPAIDKHQRASFALASGYVADAKRCLQHLNAIEATWRFDAIDQGTAPALAPRDGSGRL